MADVNNSRLSHPSLLSRISIRGPAVIAATAVILYSASLFLPQNSPAIRSFFNMQGSISSEVDVIVVGGGLAGVGTALRLAESDKKLSVLLLEKKASCGGNSAKASSGISAAVNEHDRDAFQEDALTKRTRPELLKVLVNKSTAALEWLRDQQGVPLTIVSQLGGHSQPRTWRNEAPPNVGWAIMSTLLKKIKERHAESVTIQENARVDRLLVGTGADESSMKKVLGVKYQVMSSEGGQGNEAEVYARRGVVLATGGYSANKDILPEAIRRLATTNAEETVGDGLKIGGEVGASIIDLDAVQVHPTGLVDPSAPDAGTKFLAPEALRGSGAVLINQEGGRFVDELTTRDKVQAAILRQTAEHAFLLLNYDAIEQFGRGTLMFYVKKGFGTLCESLAEVAEAIAQKQRGGRKEEAPAISARIEKELQEYDLAVEGKLPDPHGKRVFPTAVLSSSKQEFVVLEITPVIHYTMGGLAIDDKAHVLDKEGTIIPGLFAVGEVAGGVHGDNRLAGNSLLDCTVFSSVVVDTLLHSN